MRNRRLQRLLWCGISIMLLLALLVGACAKPAAEEPIKIGGIFGVTGFLAPIGADCKQGALLALEQADYKVAGRPIEFIWEDGASDAAVSLDKARKLVEVDKVGLIIGPVFGSAQLAMAGYLDKVKVPAMTLAPSTHAIPLEHSWTFLTVGTHGQAVYASGVHAYEELGYRTVSTLASDFVGGHDFVDAFSLAFEERGGKVIQKQWYPPGNTDYVPYYLAIEKDIDAFVSWTPGAEAFPAWAQWAEMGIKLPHIEIEDGGMTTSPVAMQELGDPIKGVVTSTVSVYTADTPGNKEFVQSYQERWGVLPSTFSGATFTCVQLALEGLRKSGGDTSPEVLRQALTEVSMDTVRGYISFNQDRIATFTCFIVKVDENLVPRIIKEYRVKAERVGDEIVLSLVK